MSHILKKTLEYIKRLIKPEIFIQKSMFSNSKVKISRNFMTEFVGSTKNPNKRAASPDQPIKSKIVPEKNCFVVRMNFWNFSVLRYEIRTSKPKSSKNS
jgi:hypothetical protein